MKFCCADAILPFLAFVALPFCAGADTVVSGAVPDGKTDCTAVIQKAIDDCSATGGGRVVIPPGVYKTYMLNLRSNVDLHISHGATLKSGEDMRLYREFGPTDVWNVERSIRFNKRAMFYACGVTNIAITGSGTIDGNAEAFHHETEKTNWTGFKWWRKSDSEVPGRCLFVVGCRDVKIEDVLIYHACGWSTFFLDCERIGIRSVRIQTKREFPNGDGLHFGACRDVTVSDCIIDTLDDSIVVRNHQELLKRHRVCERLVFQNCVLRSQHTSAIRIGYTCDGPIRDVLFDNIVAEQCGNALQIVLRPIPEPPAEWRDPPRGRGLPVPPPESREPFSVEGVRFSNFRANCLRTPIQVVMGKGEKVAFVRDITFSGCSFRSARPPFVDCRPEDGFSDWNFSDVRFEVVKQKGAKRSNSAWFENVRDVSFDNVRWSFVEAPLHDDGKRAE